MFHNRHAVAVASPHGAWGYYETSVGRYGHITERLRVLPPDTTAHERRLWAALRIWPTAGFLTAIVVALATDPVLGTPTALLAGAIVWVAPMLWLWRATRPFVGRIHEAWAGHTIADEEVMDRAQLRCLAGRLAGAEARFLADRTAEREFRAEWTAAYAEIADTAARAA